MKIFRYLCLFIVMWSSWAVAEPAGTCWSNMVITLKPTASFSSGKKGTTAHFSWEDKDGSSLVPSTCTRVPSGSSILLNHYKAIYTPNLTYDGTQVVLNDYLAIKNFKVDVWPNNSYAVPFLDFKSTLSNCNNHLCVNSGEGGPDSISLYRAMWRFSGDLVLTKTVLSGVIIVPNVPVTEGYFSTSSEFASAPEMTYILGFGPIPITTDCSINGGNQIDVEFGHVQSTDITASGLTSAARKDQALDISCTSDLNQDVEVTFEGTASSFSSDALVSSSTEIGIAILHNGVVIPPRSSFDLHLDEGKATTSLTFAVVKDPNVTTLTGGAFSASGTLIMSSD